MTRKSKLTLLVDGNWLLMSRLAVIVGRYPEMNELNRELKLLMIRSVNLVLRTFPQIDNIIFVADGGSWRNTEVKIPYFLDADGVEYKGNRTHSEEIDWDVIFSGYEDFLTTLSNNNVTVCREKMIEGDDWCWWWSTYLNSLGTNVMIWSKDRDLTQLVNTDNDGCFTVCWNKEGGITCMDKDEDDFNFLFNNDFSENDKLFHTLLNKSVSVNKINPKEVCIDKIIRGDAGDNILPIIVKKSKNENSTRQYKVSNKDIDTGLNIYDDNKVREYIENLCEMKSYKNRIGDRTPAQIFEHFVYNRTLVVLNDSVYPNNVKDIMKAHTDFNICKDLTEVEHIINAQRSELTDILEVI